MFQGVVPLFVWKNRQCFSMVRVPSKPEAEAQTNTWQCVADTMVHKKCAPQETCERRTDAVNNTRVPTRKLGLENPALGTAT